MRALDSSSSELMLFDVICISARNRLGHVVPVLPTNSHQTCIVRSFIPTHVPEREPLAACSRQGLRMTLPVKSSRCLTSLKNSNEHVERYNSAYRCDDATARRDGKSATLPCPLLYPWRLRRRKKEGKTDDHRRRLRSRRTARSPIVRARPVLR